MDISLIKHYMKKFSLPTAILLGILCSSLDFTISFVVAENIATIFIRLLKLISMPIIFLSIISTITGIDNFKTLKFMGKKIINYTFFTTTLAALIGLALIILIKPASVAIQLSDIPTTEQAQTLSLNILPHLISIVPNNILQPFLEGNVLAVLFLALLISWASLQLPTREKQTLHNFFKIINSVVLKLTSCVISILPVAIWAFTIIFINQLTDKSSLPALSKYFTCIIAANLIQASIILPLLLVVKGISPFRVFKAMQPALVMAFFSKSSSATLPLTMKCAKENLHIKPEIAEFSLPLCTTINMNACAAFILITVLFVAQIHGIQFSYLDMIIWVGIATIAAIGNAGVPMGCYFMASALLAYLDVPLEILGLILPVYLLLDMLETAINVWSDSCITVILNKKSQSKFNKEILPQNY